MADARLLACIEYLEGLVGDEEVAPPSPESVALTALRLLQSEEEAQEALTKQLEELVASMPSRATK